MAARLSRSAFWPSCLASAILMAFAFGAVDAAGADRVALVVGNEHYGSLGTLATPLNDAADIADELTKAGFQVVLATDVNQRTFSKKLSDFATSAEGADIAAFYYAGHGLQYQSENYLIPVDATLQDRFALAHETVRLAEIEDAVSRARTALIYIDACRQIPEPGTFFGKVNERIVPVHGLASVSPPVDMFIGFSASPGQTAQDGLGRNSPFASAMLRLLPQPGLPLSDMFGRIVEAVKEDTHGAQKPQGYGTIRPDLYLVAALPATPPAVGPTADERAYEAAVAVGTPGAFNIYLEAFPNGYYSALAKEQLGKLQASAPSGTLASPGPTAAVDPVARCDELASDPTDPNHVGPGVPYEGIDAAAAVPACLAATVELPNEPRLDYQYGRSLMAAKDSNAALVAFQTAAARGYAEAMTSVARAMRDGDAISRDVPGSIELMKKAASAGSSNAMASLGVMYSRGTIVGRDDDAAVQWYQKSADLSNPLGLNNLASMYRDGRGVPRNPETAATFYERAAELGYPAAMYNLALLLDAGKGVQRDGQREAALLIRAVTLDHDLYDALMASRDQLSDELVRALQGVLQQRGRYVGTIDGKFGKDTRAALAAEVGH